MRRAEALALSCCPNMVVEAHRDKRMQVFADSLAGSDTQSNHHDSPSKKDDDLYMHDRALCRSS